MEIFSLTTKNQLTQQCQHKDCLQVGSCDVCVIVLRLIFHVNVANPLDILYFQKIKWLIAVMFESIFLLLIIHIFS